MVMVCAMGGAIPVVAGWSNLPDAEDWMMLAGAWVGHWAIAGLMLWGLVIGAIDSQQVLQSLVHPELASQLDSSRRWRPPHRVQ